MDNVFNTSFWMDAWVNDAAGKDTLAVHKGFATSDYWDKASVTYNTDKTEISTRRTDKALAALKEKGLLFEGMRVLDIGCGTGTMSLTLALEGAHVTAMDFSSGMLDRLRADIPEEIASRITLVQEDWHNLNIQKKGWEKAFDLVVAFMSPAVAGPEAFSKMIQCAAKGCAVRGWAAREQPAIFKDLWKKIMNRPLDDKPQSILYKINLLFAMGLYPDIYFDVIEWNQTIPLEIEEENQVSFFLRATLLPEEQIRPVIHRCLKAQTMNGQLKKQHKGLTATAVFLVDPLI